MLTCFVYAMYVLHVQLHVCMYSIYYHGSWCYSSWMYVVIRPLVLLYEHNTAKYSQQGIPLA